MDEEVNQIKDYLFEYIKNSHTIPQLIAERKFDEVINEIMSNCYDQIVSMGKKEES